MMQPQNQKQLKLILTNYQKKLKKIGGKITNQGLLNEKFVFKKIKIIFL